MHELRLEGSYEMAAEDFFEDGLPHNDSEDECAEEVARYIRSNGLRNFINDWNLMEFDIYVGDTLVARDGKVVLDG